MSHFQKQILSCLLVFVLLYSSCALLSYHHTRSLREILSLCDRLPSSLHGQEDALLKASELEEKLKKAGTSLAFFVNYEQLNTAYLAAATLKSAAEQKDEREYARAAVALKEAIGTLLRAEGLSLEGLI